jgi:hypothetical protein
LKKLSSVELVLNGYREVSIEAVALLVAGIPLTVLGKKTPFSRSLSMFGVLDVFCIPENLSERSESITMNSIFGFIMIISCV